MVSDNTEAQIAQTSNFILPSSLFQLINANGKRMIEEEKDKYSKNNDGSNGD